MNFHCVRYRFLLFCAFQHQTEALLSLQLYALLRQLMVPYLRALWSATATPSDLCLDKVLNESEGINRWLAKSIRYKAKTLLIIVHILNELNTRCIDTNYLKLADCIFHSFASYTFCCFEIFMKYYF